ncbi:hypothetical protein BDB01DRAFT_809389 [Pilobolus umbonatus]|nr:hypothetical protein BDB01DRAFT_809389 [Pilobolus umbonatus]
MVNKLNSTSSCISSLLDTTSLKKDLFIKNEEMPYTNHKKLKLLHHTEKELYYANHVGHQVKAYKEDMDSWYTSRIVDYSPTLVFIHYEGWPPDQADWIPFNYVQLTSQTTNYGPSGRESKQSWEDYRTFYYSSSGKQARSHTGLVSDRRMILHTCPCQSREITHPERPDRITSIFKALHSRRLLRYFKRIRAREVTPDELLRVHTFSHVRNYFPLLSQSSEKPIKITSIAAILNHSPPPSPKSMTFGVGGGKVIKIEKQNKQCHLFTPPDLLYKMSCGELGIAVDTTYHPLYSRVSAKISAGGLIELVDAIVREEIKNGFALIRPPGHHAEDDAAMGYCFYNNVAVAASNTLDKYPSKIKRIMIIDWDIHHGNGTQKIFYDNPDVLYVSIHRWEHGKFYPFSGAPDECGQLDGLGYNVNIALNESKEKSKPMGDTEFLAAFYHLIIPIAKQFKPDMIFVSAGYDAAEGHPENIGGYKVTARGYATMTKMVCDLADELCEGRLVLTLEGGYELQSLANCATSSIIQLLSDHEDQIEYKHSLHAIKPNLGAIESFKTIVDIQKKHWNLPDQLSSPQCKFQLPVEWKIIDNITNRPKRDKSMKSGVVEGY